MGAGTSVSNSNITTIATRQPAVSSNTSSVLLSSDEVSTSILVQVQEGTRLTKTKNSSTEICCDLCRTSRDYMQAVAYCSDCCEYYCNTCYRGHSRSKVSKDHTILDYSNIYCDPCHTTSDNIQAEGYCADCNEYYCQSCYRTHSRMKATMDHNLMDKSTMPITFKIPKSVPTQIKTPAPVSTQIKTPAPVSTQILTPAPVSTQIKTPAPVSTQILTPAPVSTQIKTPAPVSTQIKTPAPVSTQIKTPAPMPTQIKTPAIVPSQFKTPAQASNTSTNIHKQPAAVQFQDTFHFHCDINIKHTDEKTDCLITGISAISDNELVIVDPNNKSVKLLDIDQNIIKYILCFDTRPFSITTIPHGEVAITFADEDRIRILSTVGGLSVKRSIKLSGACTAVQYFNNKLYVSYQKPVDFQIISLSGGVMKTIQPDVQVLHHCTLPYYITVHPDESRMYISDCVSDVVLCMDMAGTMLAVYKDAGLECPCDIIFTPPGSIYLCNEEQHIIYKMADDLSEAIIVLGPQDGLVFPTAICFSPGRKSLYIGSGDEDPKFCNMIKQYKYS